MLFAPIWCRNYINRGIITIQFNLSKRRSEHLQYFLNLIICNIFLSSIHLKKKKKMYLSRNSELLIFNIHSNDTSTIFSLQILSVYFRISALSALSALLENINSIYSIVNKLNEMDFRKWTAIINALKENAKRLKYELKVN